MKEGLLLKVIPRHLVADMKEVLSRTLVDVDVTRDTNKLLHVDRRDKVRSVAFISIYRDTTCFL